MSVLTRFSLIDGIDKRPVCAGLLLWLLCVLVSGDIETCQRIPVDTDVNADVDVDAMSM